MRSGVTETELSGRKAAHTHGKGHERQTQSVGAQREWGACPPAPHLFFLPP